jgi:hypothetical protein
MHPERSGYPAAHCEAVSAAGEAGEKRSKKADGGHALKRQMTSKKV